MILCKIQTKKSPNSNLRSLIFLQGYKVMQFEEQVKIAILLNEIIEDLVSCVREGKSCLVMYVNYVVFTLFLNSFFPLRFHFLFPFLSFFTLNLLFRLPWLPCCCCFPIHGYSSYLYLRSSLHDFPFLPLFSLTIFVCYRQSSR